MDANTNDIIVYLTNKRAKIQKIFEYKNYPGTKLSQILEECDSLINKFEEIGADNLSKKEKDDFYIVLLKKVFIVAYIRNETPTLFYGELQRMTQLIDIVSTKGLNAAKDFNDAYNKERESNREFIKNLSNEKVSTKENEDNFSLDDLDDILSSLDDYDELNQEIDNDYSEDDGKTISLLDYINDSNKKNASIFNEPFVTNQTKLKTKNVDITNETAKKEEPQHLSTLDAKFYTMLQELYD